MPESRFAIPLKMHVLNDTPFSHDSSLYSSHISLVKFLERAELVPSGKNLAKSSRLSAVEKLLFGTGLAPFLVVSWIPYFDVQPPIMCIVVF